MTQADAGGEISIRFGAQLHDAVIDALTLDVEILPRRLRYRDYEMGPWELWDVPDDALPDGVSTGRHTHQGSPSLRGPVNGRLCNRAFPKMTLPRSSWLTENFTNYLDYKCDSLKTQVELALIRALNDLRSHNEAWYSALCLHQQGQSYAQIAVRLGCSKSAAYKYARKAEEFLRGCERKGVFEEDV